MLHSVYKTTNLINQKYYIGKHSSVDPNDKYLGSGKALLKAIKKYGILNFKKEILFIYEQEVDAYNKEREILEELDGINDPLCYNLCYGGVGFWKGSNHSIYTKEKISEGNKGKVLSDEHKEKLRNWHTGKIVSLETKKKLSELNIGKKHTKETKEKLSSINKGKKRTLEFCENQAKRQKGKAFWPKGKPRSDETKAKMSKAHKGKILSDETKAKLSEYTGDKNSQFGSMWITDGNKNKKINKDEKIPDGWRKGRFFKEGYKRVRS